MDESEIDIPRFDPKVIEMIIFAALALAILVSYRQYLKRSLAIQEATALAQIERLPTEVQIPVTGMNGKVHIVDSDEVKPTPGVPVIKDAETSAVVESTEGPGQIKQNTGE